MKSVVMAFLGSVVMAAGEKTNAPVAPATINPLHCVHVTDQGGRLVNGCYDVSRFVVENGGIWAYCKLRGTCDGVEIIEDCVVPVTVGDCDSGTPREIAANSTGSAYTCDCVKISFGSCGSRELAFTFDLNPTECSCTSVEFPSELLCSILTACHTVGTPREIIASSLNQLL